jgi:WD40 repeat protein
MRFVLAAVLVLTLAVVTSAQEAEEAKPEGKPEGKPTLVVETGGHSAQITRVLFTPKSKEMITVSLDKTARIWDVATGTLLRTIRPPQSVGDSGELWAAALSADGKVVALGGRGLAHPKVQQCPIFLVEVATGKLVRAVDFPMHEKGHGWVRTLALHGKTLAVGGTGGKIVLFDAETGVRGKEFDAHKGGTSEVVFSPNGNRLASVGADHVGRVWSVADGTKLAELEADEKMRVGRSIAWSPDGKSIAAGLSEEKRPGATHFGIWTPKGKLVRRIYHTHADRQYAVVRSLAFTPDSKEIVETGTCSPEIKKDVADVGAASRHAFAIRWDVHSGARRHTYFNTDFRNEDVPGAPALVSPNAQFVAVADDRNHRTYLYEFGGKLVRMMPKGEYKPERDGTVRASRGRQITEVAWVKSKTQPLQVVWRTERLNDEVRDLKAKQLDQKFFQYALNLDEMQLAPVPPPPYRLRQFGNKDVKLVWERAAVKVERDGKTATIRPAGTDEDWVQLRALTLAGPDRAVVAKRNSLHVYDIHNVYDIKFLYNLLGPDGVTRSAAPSPDNRYVAAGGDDQVLRIWDPSKPKDRAPLLSVYATAGDWVAWTPAGYYAASAGGERLIGWHVDNGTHKLASFYPISGFRKQFLRPDVIALVLEKGSVAEALKAANAALVAQGKKARSAEIEQLLPPKATIVVDRSKEPLLTIRAQATAGTEQQPIKGLRLYMDGRPFADATKEVKYEAKYGPGVVEATETWPVTLPAGEHHFAVLATGPDVKAFSEPYAIEGKGVDVGKAAKMFVLSVGINKYKDRALKLDTAADDARKLADAFSKNCKGPLFSAVPVKSLLDKDAEKEAILDEIAKVKKQAKENDLFVFNFAGHGAKDKDQFYLLPVGADVFDLANTALSGDELRKKVMDFPCQVVLVLDACHSAGFGEGCKLATAGLRPATDDATRMLTDDDVGVVVMCAAMGHEKAIELKNGGGLFTSALLDALAAGPGVQRHPNGKIYIHHLHSYVFDQVSYRSEERQHPFLHLPWIVESFPVR